MTQFNLDLINKWPIFGWPLSSTSALALSVYAVNDFDPSLVFDFEQNYYRTGGTDSTLSSSVTHAATSNATMTDSDGNIKWRPHNLVKYSEQFDNAAWQQTEVVVSANTTTAPDGTLTADLINGDGSNFKFRTISSVSVSAGAVTVSVFLKYADHRYVTIGSGTAFWGTLIGSTFDLLNGTVSDAGTATASSMVDVGNGWFKAAITLTTTANPYIFIKGTSTGTFSAGTTSAATTTGFYIWGAHLYRSDLGGMANNPAQPTGLETYVPTSGSAVYLPRVGHHIYNGSAWVNEGVLHESEARTNIVNYSSDFSSYTKLLVNTSVPTGITSPDGTENSTQIVTTSGSGVRRIYDITPNGDSSLSWCLSLFVKHKDDINIKLWLNGATQPNSEVIAYFAISASGVSLTSTETGSTSSTAEAGVENVGNGWYRVYVKTAQLHTNSSAKPTLFMNLETSISGAGLYMYGLQIEQGSTPSSYIPTSGSTVTRAAETLTVPAANLPWPTVVETTGTELVTNGTFDTNSDWTLANAVISGGVADATNGTRFLAQNAGLVTGSIYKITLDFTRGSTSGNGKIRVNTTATNGGGTEHVSGTFSSIGSSGSLTYVLVAEGPYIAIEAAGNTFSGTIDNVTIKEINPLSVSIQMDGRMTYADNNSSTANSDVGGEVTFVRWKLNNVNWLGSMVNAKSPKVGQVNFRQYGSGALDLTQTADDYYNYANNPVSFNIASRHGSTFINGAVDGTALTANTTPVALPDLSTTDLQLGYDFMGTIGKFRMWSDDLTDTGIATASAPSTEPSLQLTFDGSSTSSFKVLDWSE